MFRRRADLADSWAGMNDWINTHEPNLIPKVIGGGFCLAFVICSAWYFLAPIWTRKPPAA